MESDQYLYPTAKGRIVQGAILIIALLVIIFLKSFVQSLSPPENENTTIEELKADTEYLNSISLTIAVTSIIFCLGLAGFSIRKGNETIKKKQFPPPGSPVFFKTKIRSGKYALRLGIGCYILGVVYLALVSFFGYLIWSLYQ